MKTKYHWKNFLPRLYFQFDTPYKMIEIGWLQFIWCWDEWDKMFEVHFTWR